MATGEVITLQLGEFANFVGAHYWNFQDELLGLSEATEWRDLAQYTDPEVLFRRGETSQGQPTYTPRLLLFDLCGALGGVSAGQFTPSTAVAPAALTWSGRAEVYQADPIERSSFVEQLDIEADGTRADDREGPAGLECLARSLSRPGAVRYWTDYLKVCLHPKSVFELPGAWHGVSAFNGFGDGAWVMESEMIRDEIVDRIRFFAEECDMLQGFQCIVEDSGGFGRLGLDVLGYVQDEFASSPIMLHAVRRPAAASQDDEAAIRIRTLNEIFSYGLLSEHASVYAAIAPPAVALQTLRLQSCAADAFCTSALCAAALDTASLPYRLARPATAQPLGFSIGATTMQSLAHLISRGSSNPLAALGAALPAPCIPADSEITSGQRASHVQRQMDVKTACDANVAETPFTRSAVSWTPGVRLDACDILAESIVLRGACNSRGDASTSQLAAAALDASLLREGCRCTQRRCVVPQPLPVPLPFPQLFFGNTIHCRTSGSTAGRAGGRDGTGSEEWIQRGPKFVSGLTRLAATQEFKAVLVRQLLQLKAISDTSSGRAITSAWGYGREELFEVQERLHELARDE